MIEILFPPEARLCVKQIEIDDEEIDIYLQVSEQTAKCPGCQETSRKIHSQYFRHPHDLPCMGYRFNCT